MIRLILILLFVVLFLVIGCIPAFVFWLIGKKNPGLKDRLSRSYVRFGFYVVYKLSGSRYTVEGLENIPADRPVLYVGNHRGYFDVVISYLVFPAVTGYVAKVEFLKIPLLSLWMKYIHCLFLDRKNIKEGLKTILKGIEEVKSGISLCIYPEGTRARTENELDLLPFKEGSMKIAEKSGCPVIPIAMLHTSEILEDHFPRIRPAVVKIRIGEPIDLKKLEPEQRKHSGEHLRSVLIGMLTQMREDEKQ